MKEVREKKKYRISYSYDNCEFDIDDYCFWDNEKKIPPLLEIEANTVEEIEKQIKKLWLESHIKKNWWSRKLFQYYW
jgi:hypothetical protein